MQVISLDHVNIITADLKKTTKFYSGLLQLVVKNGPKPMRPEHAQWLYDMRGRAVIHVNVAGAYQVFEKNAKPCGPTGALHHVAFDCEGYADLLKRVKAMSLDYKTNEVTSIGLKQVFVFDPNDVLLELNFRNN